MSKKKDGRILILEDHPGLGNLINEMFSSKGYEVTLATNGEQGLKHALEGGYSAIIAAIKMPVMDGIEFLKGLQQAPPTPKNGPIIMYSNFAYQYSKDEVLALGATDFIAKDTLGTSELVNKVEDLIANPDKPTD